MLNYYKPIIIEQAIAKLYANDCNTTCESIEFICDEMHISKKDRLLLLEEWQTYCHDCEWFNIDEPDYKQQRIDKLLEFINN
jgi:hypothetical protein